MQLFMSIGETGDGPLHVAEVIVAVATSRQRADALAAQAAAARHQSNGQTVYDAVYVRPLAADTLVDHDADVHVPSPDSGVSGHFRVLCDGQHDDGRQETEAEHVDAVSTQAVPAGS